MKTKQDETIEVKHGKTMVTSRRTYLDYPLASISLMQITIMVTFSFCRLDICSTIPYSHWYTRYCCQVALHPWRSKPSSSWDPRSQTPGQSVDLRSCPQSRIQKYRSDGKRKGMWKHFPTNIIVDKHLQKGCESWFWKARSIDFMLEVGMWSGIMKQHV